MPSFFYPSDDAAPARAFEPPAPRPGCFDCGTTDEVRVSTPVHGGRWHCDSCWRVRQANGWEFDQRSLSLLLRGAA